MTTVGGHEPGVLFHSGIGLHHLAGHRSQHPHRLAIGMGFGIALGGAMKGKSGGKEPDTDNSR